MEKYVELLNKMKDNRWNEKYLSQLEKIESYVKGEISSDELLLGTDDVTKGIIYFTINKLLNYNKKDVRYFIELPKDMFFNTHGSPCILAGKDKEYGIRDNTLETIGPKKPEEQSSFLDLHYIEIEGDFSKYPKGVMLFFSDWYRIISKFPKIYERMYFLTKNDYAMRNRAKDITFEEVKEEAEKIISKNVEAPRDYEPNTFWRGKEEAQYIPQEVIDSIRFVIPTEYLTRQQVLSGDFGSFEELAKGIKSNISEKKDNESKIIDKPIQTPNNSKQTEDENDDIIRVGLGDIADYIQGPSHKYISHAIDFDMQYMTENAVRGSTKKELVAMLADFILNYRGNDVQSHLNWLANDSKVINGRICNIPIIEFAKLNNPEVVTLLSQLGAEDIKTSQSENKDAVESVAKMFGYDKERKTSMSDTISVINDILGTNAEEPFKKK